MPIVFDNNRSIYQQIISKIQQSIANGDYPAGSQIPSVRDLAMEFGVNPNTVQKSLSVLEQEKYLYSNKTIGRFVTDDKELILSLKTDICERIIKTFITDMENAKIKRENIIMELEKYLII